MAWVSSCVFGTDAFCVCAWSVLTCLFVLCCSAAQSCPAPCDPVDSSTPGLPALHHLLELVLCVYQLLFIISPCLPDYACVCVLRGNELLSLCFWPVIIELKMRRARWFMYLLCLRLQTELWLVLAVEMMEKTILMCKNSCFVSTC